MEYKHYSFDLWRTLIRPNEQYREEKRKHIQKLLARSNRFVSLDDVNFVINEVWKEFDFVSKFSGKAPDALEMLALVMFRLGASLPEVTPLRMNVLYRELEQLFYKYPPTLWDEDTKHVLEELKKRGKSMSLLSNTSYIKGKTLSKVMKDLGIWELFNFTIFSDEVGYSKPCTSIYRILDMRLPRPLTIEDVIHVGDDLENDGMAPQEYGFGHMIINSNSFTIKDLL